MLDLLQWLTDRQTTDRDDKLPEALLTPWNCIKAYAVKCQCEWVWAGSYGQLLLFNLYICKLSLIFSEHTSQVKNVLLSACFIICLREVLWFFSFTDSGIKCYTKWDFIELSLYVCWCHTIMSHSQFIVSISLSISLCFCSPWNGKLFINSLNFVLYFRWNFSQFDLGALSLKCGQCKIAGN